MSDAYELYKRVCNPNGEHPNKVAGYGAFWDATSSFGPSFDIKNLDGGVRLTFADGSKGELWASDVAMGWVYLVTEG